MPNIFSSRAGRVVRLPSANAPDGANTVVMAISVENLGKPNITKSVVTKVGLNEKVAAQFADSFGNMLHVYIFGDSPSQLAVSGFSFAESCGEQDGKLGLDHIAKYWRENRASSRQTAVLVGIGTEIAMKAFLIDFQVESQDPSTSLMQFSLGFVCPPRGPVR